MNALLRTGRRILLWAAGALALLLGLIVLLALAAAAAMDRNHFRDAVVRFISARSNRPIQIEGTLRLRLLSSTPRLDAEGVTIGNPPWMPAGELAQLGHVSLTLERWPLFGREFEIQRLEIEAANLHLAREEDGRANWQWRPPHQVGGGQGPPLIHSFTLAKSALQFEDARRHLSFKGSLSAEVSHRTAGEPWHLEGAGQLNGRAATFALNGDPLAGVSHDRPYRFAFAERSSGSRLDGRGELPRPFDFRVLEASFEAAGEDLKDLYFLTGVTLPDTGAYRVSGKVTRQGSHFEYRDLLVTAGQSDLRGSMSIETAHGHAHIEAELESQALRWSDLGARAAGRASEPEPSEAKLFSAMPLPLNAVRHGDASINYHARNLQVGRVALHAVTALIRIDQGSLLVGPLSAQLPEGRISGHVKLDAGHELPKAQLDLSIADLRISQFDHKSPQTPAFDGLLQTRLELVGQGRSIHDMAASADGTVTAVLPTGAIRTSFAELAGMDLARGLGLLLSKDQKETGIRCGIASFRAHQGTLDAQQLIIDTDPVLISGAGQIHLDSETLALSLHGEPKSRRLLRLHEPVWIKGTLLHASVGLENGNSPLRTGQALAAGIARTPLEVLGFVDPQLASNADCAALISAAGRQGVPATAPTSTR